MHSARLSAAASVGREQRYGEELFEHTHDGVFVLDVTADGRFRIVELNPAEQRMIGISNADARGRYIDELLPPDVAGPLLANYQRCVESAGPLTYDEEIDLPAGHRAFTTTLIPVLDDHGRVGRIIGVGRDVTHEKGALKALRESEARYRRMIETTNEGVWLSDADMRTSFVNARMAAMLGYSAEELIGVSGFDLMAPEQRAPSKVAWEDHKRGVGGQTERELLRRDGTTMWAWIESSPIFDDAGTYEGTLAMVTDITERRHAEELLRVSEARFRRLWDSGIILATIWDPDGTVCEINDAGARMLGYTREELVGRISLSDLTPAESRDADKLAGEQIRATGVATMWEKQLIRKDGTRLEILAGAALDGPGGIGIAIDITEKKRVENALRGAEEALRHSEDQLRQAQKMEAVGRLAGGVAHDFNNVLSVILSYGDLLLEEIEPSDPKRADVEQICIAATRAADMTRQLLLFSRQQVIEPKLVDLNALLVDMDKMLQRILGEDVELVLVTDASIGRVRVDPTSIGQVVMNLVVNARDAMPTGGRLTIETSDVVLDEEFARAHVGAKPGPYVMLAVSDTGVGIEKGTQARIFEPFFTTKAVGKGTGLGLSTVFGIIQRCGGTLWVHSEPGHGATFKVYLPRIDAPADAIRPTIPPATLRGSETILLVEDEDQVRAVARSILTRSGYQVIEARNGGEALLVCEKHPGVIHLLLSDVVMPHMSGPELALRVASTKPEMKVLCMSGYTDDSIVRLGILDAKIAYLQKPITRETLTRKVRDVLDAPRG